MKLVVYKRHRTQLHHSAWHVWCFDLSSEEVECKRKNSVAASWSLEDRDAAGSLMQHWYYFVVPWNRMGKDAEQVARNNSVLKQTMPFSAFRNAILCCQAIEGWVGPEDCIAVPVSTWGTHSTERQIWGRTRKAEPFTWKQTQGQGQEWTSWKEIPLLCSWVWLTFSGRDHLVTFWSLNKFDH